MKQLEADLVVVGGGMSGLSAATAAAEKGMSVIVLEKGSTTGGAANMGMGFFAIGSERQKDDMYTYTVDEAFEDFMTYTHWMPDARLVKRIFEQSADTVRWVEDMGVEFLGAYKYFMESKATWHIVKVPGSNKPVQRCASLMVKAMTDRAIELGVEFRFNTSVKELTMEDGGAAGAIAVTDEGEELEALGNAVIVGTGGFGNNVDMIREYLGFEWGKDIFTFRIPGIDGEGMKMVWKAGGGKTPVNMEITYNTPGLTDIYATISETMRQPNMMVNLDGVRFFNEAVMMNTTFTGNAIMRQKGRCGFTIIDEKTIDYYRENDLDYISYHHAIRSVERWDKEVDAYLKGEGVESDGLAALHEDKDYQTNFWVCENIEEVAEVTGINLSNLMKTIDEYNAMDGRADKEFGKPARYMKGFGKGKLYVMRHFPSGYGSLGGIKTDHNMQVLTENGGKIPGLFACGTDACAIFGDSYCFIMPGSTMGFAINSGRIAGYEAARFIDEEFE
jgi:fumarate reductase flavoprotein subunit